MANEPRDSPVRRRTFLTYGTAVGLAGLAGCLGDDDDDGAADDSDDTATDVDDDTADDSADDTADDSTATDDGDTTGDTQEEVDLTMITSQEDTLAFAMSQAVAGVMNQHSDMITLEALPAGGAAQGMAQMDRGDADIAYTNALNAINIHNEREIYEDNPFGHEIQQLFHYYDVQYGWMTSGEFHDDGLRTVEDLDGRPVSPKAAGTASRDVIFAHLDHAGVSQDDLGDLLSLAGTEDGPALNEGRAHAVNDIRLNVDVAPGYIQEMFSIVDDVYQVGWPEDVVEDIQDDEELAGSILTDEDVDPAPIQPEEGVPWWPTALYSVYATDRMEDDVADEFLRVIWENVEEIADAQALAGYWSDAEFFSDVSPAVPTHPAAEDFFEEIL